MGWDRIYGHSKIKEILQGAIMQKRIPNAYLFWGIEGIGKEAVALQLAKVLNCESPIFTKNTVDSCDLCKSCRSADNFQHPNIKFIFPLPAGKTEDKEASPIAKLNDEQIAQIREQLALKSNNPYHQIKLSGNCQIRISSVREIKKDLSLTQTLGGVRCIVISKADEMTAESANAFLKTLEEPSQNTLIILISSRRDEILQTIRSRCQQIYFHQLDDNDIINYLIKYHNISEKEAAIIASISQGSITKAMEFLDKDMLNLKEEVINLLRNALKKKIYRMELIERINNLVKEKDRGKIENALIILQLWFQDAIRISIDPNTDYVVNYDQKDIIMKFLSNFSNTELDLIVLKIEEAINDIYKNVNLQLLLTTLFLYIRKILFSNKL